MQSILQRRSKVVIILFIISDLSVWNLGTAAFHGSEEGEGFFERIAVGEHRGTDDFSALLVHTEETIHLVGG